MSDRIAAIICTCSALVATGKAAVLVSILVTDMPY